VIAGTARGTRLSAVPRGVRPVSDMAREGIFSSLGPAVVGAAVLDLYAGTGAMGIEALSRGAGSATFVERDRRALEAIRANLERTHVAERARVVGADVLAFLRKGPAEPHEVALADPPYEAGDLEVSRLMAEVVSGWVGPDATMLLTRRKGNPKHVVPVHWRLARRLEYGDTLALIYRPSRPAS
jgi:16S rRNA (guanine966-N2)-methyltransferase